MTIEFLLLFKLPKKNATEDDELLPVIVWFHPGKFQEGGAVFQYWNPQYLIEYDIVVVTVNYRLGPFGKFMFVLILLLQSIIVINKILSEILLEFILKDGK